jgi:hypothetical protein
MFEVKNTSYFRKYKYISVQAGIGHKCVRTTIIMTGEFRLDTFQTKETSFPCSLEALASLYKRKDYNRETDDFIRFMTSVDCDEV